MSVSRAALKRKVPGDGQGPTKPQQEDAEVTISNIVDTFLEVARQRKAILNDMRNALESGDNEGVEKLARQLCGLSDEKSNRTNTRVN